MALNVTALTIKLKAQLVAFTKQLNETTEKRYVFKQPVVDVAALAAITAPTEGEQRQIGSAPPYVAYVYNAGNATPEVECDDGSAGGWMNTTPVSDNDYWVSGKTYVADDLFSFTSAADVLDANGNDIAADTLYVGRYVDGSGDAAETVAGASLSAAEILKIQVVHGDELADKEISQAEIDAIYGV